MPRVVQILSAMSRWEKWTLAVLSVAFVLSAAGLVQRFHTENTVLVASTGGTYIEGSVGELQPLNPWFIVQNDVNRDIVSLVFAGLLKYNPQTKKIEEDLATMEVSKDNKVYTLKLRDGVQWQDSTAKAPHPVTADDVLFTYETIQDPDFPNLLLQQNFRGVKIEKVDDRTVRFTLDEAYSFFPSNLTLGLLPKKSFEGFPVAKYEQMLDFGYAPVGAGPYRVKSVVPTELSSEVTLEKFPRAFGPEYHLERIVFRIFPDYSTLLSDIRNLQGVRLVPKNDAGAPMVPKRFIARNYYLPQYVALFLNLDRKPLQDQKLRTGLQQGTDKQAIVDAIHESVIVDTPLMEMDLSDWHYKLDAGAAQGALLASKWNLPERVRLQKVLEQQEANKTGALHVPLTVVQIDPAQGLTLSGSYETIPRASHVNGVPLLATASGAGTWTAHFPFQTGTGALKPGDNLLTLTDDRGKTLDSYYLFVTADPAEYKRAVEERRLASSFSQTRTGQIQQDQKVTIGDLFLDRGMLRLRQKSDPVSVRVNEKGEQLKLTLLTSPTPPVYKKVAQLVKEQWARLGVLVDVQVPVSRDEFEQRLLTRDYDVLLFGQSLLDNMDSYPYWHSTGVQKLTGHESDLRRDAYNLSQYSSFKADSLLETIRRTSDEKERTQALADLRTVLKQDVPAIFLYSPLYTFAHSDRIQGIDLGSLSLHSDRFLSLHDWYAKEERVFVKGKSWGSFFGWLWSLPFGGAKKQS
jgi:ABC-type transport system substrate-binding protein